MDGASSQRSPYISTPPWHSARLLQMPSSSDLDTKNTFFRHAYQLLFSKAVWLQFPSPVPGDIAAENLQPHPTTADVLHPPQAGRNGLFYRGNSLCLYR